MMAHTFNGMLVEPTCHVIIKTELVGFKLALRPKRRDIHEACRAEGHVGLTCVKDK